MSKYRLLPRLDNVGVRRLLSLPHLLKGGSIADREKAIPGSITYAASGGTRASKSEIAELRDGIIVLAERHGFPNDMKSARKASFDADSGPWLASNSILSGGESLRDDVWAFVTCCIAPEVALWRFEDAHIDRFQGGLRNTFQRLWLRAKALDRGVDAKDRWYLIRALSEDAVVQIIERPSIGADPMIARAVAEAWVKTAAKVGVNRMEAITRKAVRRIRIANEITCFSALDEAEVLARFGRYFDDVVQRHPEPIPSRHDDLATLAR